MCFSNLPIEFDDEGNPYLAEEADDVDRPSGTGAASASASNCGCANESDDVPLDEADPEAVYEEILETMPRDVRDQLPDSSDRSARAAERGRPEHGRTD